jgi:hypothetical protein
MTAGGPETCILALTFADVGPLANQKRAEWRHASALRLALWRIFEDSNLRSVSATVHELGIDPIPGAWRRVTVDISTDALTVALDGTPAFQKKREDILREAKSRLLYAVKPVQFPKDAPGLPNLENLNLGSRELFLVESLGALVSQGSGSFRNVSVTPRSNP